MADSITLDLTTKEELNKRLDALEEHFKADVIFYYGEIHPAYVKGFRDFIENLVSDKEKNYNTLVIILNTPGGSAETVEKMVDIVRFHYKNVYFVVPDFAMSAGTIFCMSGDKIFMDYSSSLGPIDPQVDNGKEYVPAMGYLDKVEEMLEKAKNKTITEAEFLILQSLDLAMLSRYEQARNLTITLLKKWLVEYKFKDWNVHSTDKKKKGQKVTKEEKEKRAEDIAELLGNNKKWHSHGRFIGIKPLVKELRLKIEDYSNDEDLRTKIRYYNDLMVDYIRKGRAKVFVHSRVFI